jgi:hypothetical protein
MTKSRGINRPKHRWSEAQIGVLRTRFPNEVTSVVAQDLGVPDYIVSKKAAQLGIRKCGAHLSSAAGGRIQRGERRSAGTEFPKGHVPINRGRKGWSPAGSERTRFKKGHTPWNGAVPIGALRVNSLGYLDRKISNDRRGALNWRAVHRLVWEEQRGPVPKGFLVAFKKGMRTTEVEKITVDALELISLADNGRRNVMWNRYPRPLAESINLLGHIKRRLRKREEEAHGSHN